MRMHEILGVEPGERFKIDGHQWEFALDSKGAVKYGKNMETFAFSDIAAEIINHPERIIRKPRLTGEQAETLKALKVLGYAYVTEDEFGPVCAHEYLPAKRNTAWRSNGSVWKDSHKRLDDLVSWSDPEPLDIVQVLKDAGVEV